MKAPASLPWWIRDLGHYLPSWLVSTLVLVAAAALALIFHRTILRVIRRFIGPDHVFIQSLISRVFGATRFALVLAAVALVLPIVPLSGATTLLIAQALAICFTLLIGWASLMAIELAGDFYIGRFKIDLADNLLARKHVTQVRVLRRAAETVVMMITIAVALMSIPQVRQFGVSLIASAGAAGIIVGLAARPVLTNLIAGVQIAITQPIRIGDAVVVENEWGWIEEITGTYIVIQIWDWRRMIVPLSYFLQTPFQNWTRMSSELIGSVMFWVDYTTPVEALRQKLSEIVENSKLWDRRVVNLQVSDVSENAMQIRALASARNSQDVWDLRCEMREKLIAFMQESYPASLPKQRAEVQGFDELSRRPANPPPRAANGHKAVAN
ncbi:MAG: mechanosensitive ion channel family protein [Methylovirgula sp.]|uniref:mechanosensitive ion channel family protein n=1 Tax=Methylovirgula sp. TaxID=1978224 RepID=UPI003075EF32